MIRVGSIFIRTYEPVRDSPAKGTGRSLSSGRPEAGPVGRCDERLRRKPMKLYHFPSPNPQKVTFALRELGLDCEIVPVDLAKGEQRKPEFLALNPFGRVPVLVDGDLVLSEAQAILGYLGEKTGRL